MNELRPLRVNAIELLRQPGALRGVEATVPAAVLDVVHDALTGDISVDVELEALNDGIVVRGSVTAPWSAPCRRCLKPLTGQAVADVDELYQVEVLDEDAYPITDGQLDLAPMTRQAALLELDDERLCQDGCAGLCPNCGVDLNVETCECDTEIRDPRWSALEGLILDE